MGSISAGKTTNVTIKAGLTLNLTGNCEVYLRSGSVEQISGGRFGPFDVDVAVTIKAFSGVDYYLAAMDDANGLLITNGEALSGIATPSGIVSSLSPVVAGDRSSGEKIRSANTGNGFQSLLLVGDSLNSRMGNAFSALGGWAASVTAITPTGGPTANLTFAAAHGLPAGQRVRFSADAIIDPVLRNRWFDFVSTGSATGTISVPFDAKDKAHLEYALANTTAFAGAAELSIDAVRGLAGSYFKTLYDLFDPFDEVYNLAIPGAQSGEEEFSDTLAFVKTLNLSEFTHVGITVGINDMAQGVLGGVTLDNIIAISELCLDAGCFVSIDEVYPQGTMDAAKQLFLQVLNPGLHAYAANRKNVVINRARDAISDSAGLGSAIDLSDGTHLNAIGAMKLGMNRTKAWGQLVKPRYAPAFPTSVDNYSANPQMFGTAGTVTAPSTGVCADSWTVAAPGTNVTCLARKQKRAALPWRYSKAYVIGDVVIPTTKTGLYYVCTTAGTSNATPPTWGAVAWATTTDNTVTWTAFPNDMFVGDVSRGEWQYVQGVVGATATTQERITLTQTITLASAGLVPGDWIRGKMHARFVDSNFAFMMTTLRTGGLINGQFSFAAGGAKNSILTATDQPTTNMDGIIATEWYKIPAGQTTMTFYIEMGATTGYQNTTMRMFITDAIVEKRPY